MSKRISQALLRSVVKQRAKIESLKAALQTSEQQLLADLKDGATVQSGALTARVKTWERRNVAWREKLVEATSQEHADRILAATRATEYEALVVETAA